MVKNIITELCDLSGKSAVVTGGGMGMGQAIAFRLSEAGANVVITDINMEAAGQTVDRILSDGGKAKAIYADSASTTDAHKVMQFTVESFGSIDIIVNNAGSFPPSPVFDITEELWDKVLSINLKGVFFYAKTAAEYMVKAGRGGKIINIASLGGIQPRRDLLLYCTSKAGVIMLTKSLALELSPHNILVNAIAPGGVVTPGGSAHAVELMNLGRSVEDSANRFIERIALNRLAEPDDIAKVVFFLASDSANYITGEVVVVDGGYLVS